MKTIFKTLGLLLAIVLVFSACHKKPQNPPVLVEDGFYVVGGSVANDSMALTGEMQPGYVEGDGFKPVLRDGMFQKYFYATANGGGFVVKQQSGQNTIQWGMSGDWNVVRKDSVFNCSIKKNGGNFTVPSDGFYLFVIDTNLLKAYLLKVYDWRVIGDATDGGWSNDENQKLTQIKLTKDEAQWKAENINLIKNGNIKFRFNGWWTYYDADTSAANNGDPKFFTNLGGDLSQLSPGGANILIDSSAVYTIELDFTLGAQTGFVATLTPTGTLQFNDISTDTVSIVGGGLGQFVKGDTVWTATWDVDAGLMMTYQTTDDAHNEIFVADSVILTKGAAFKFVLGHTWDHSWGYDKVSITGDVDSITGVDDGYGGKNFSSTGSGIYKVTFKYNGYTRAVTIDFEYKGLYVPPVQDNPSLHTISLIGDAFYQNNDPNNAATNWDEDFDLTYQNQDANGNYVFTVSGIHFIGGKSFKFRMDHDWNKSWGWGINITGDSQNFSDPGNGNIEVVNDATYDVTFVLDDSYNVVEANFTASQK